MNEYLQKNIVTVKDLSVYNLLMASFFFSMTFPDLVVIKFVINTIRKYKKARILNQNNKVLSITISQLEKYSP